MCAVEMKRYQLLKAGSNGEMFILDLLPRSVLADPSAFVPWKWSCAQLLPDTSEPPGTGRDGAVLPAALGRDALRGPSHLAPGSNSSGAAGCWACMGCSRVCVDVHMWMRMSLITASASAPPACSLGVFN